MKPKTIAVSETEGGEWRPFPSGSTIHAIKFDDGSIWDAVSGWRRGKYNALSHTSEMDDAAEIERLLND